MAAATLDCMQSNPLPVQFCNTKSNEAFSRPPNTPYHERLLMPEPARRAEHGLQQYSRHGAEEDGGAAWPGEYLDEEGLPDEEARACPGVEG